MDLGIPVGLRNPRPLDARLDRLGHAVAPDCPAPGHPPAHAGAHRTSRLSLDVLLAHRNHPSSLSSVRSAILTTRPCSPPSAAHFSASALATSASIRQFTGIASRLCICFLLGLTFNRLLLLATGDMISAWPTTSKRREIRHRKRSRSRLRR